MLVTLLLMLSAALIGAGAALLLRDWTKKKRKSFLAGGVASRTERLEPEEAQITISRAGSLAGSRTGSRTEAMLPEDFSGHHAEVLQPMPAKPVLRVAVRVQPEGVDNAAPLSAPAPVPLSQSAPDPEPEPRTELVTRPMATDRADPWHHALQRMDAAVARANVRLADSSFAIGLRRVPMATPQPAEQSATFPVLIAGQREAWLRLEADPRGHVVARVTVLALQGAIEQPSEHRIDPESASDADLDALLDTCLLPLAPRAAQLDAEAQPAPEIRIPTPVAAVPPASNPAAEFRAPREGAIDSRLASEHAWRTTESTLLAALRATTRALAQVDTRLVEVARPQWEPSQQKHRLQLALLVSGNDVARVYIDRLAHEFEVSVVGTSVGGRELGRRRRVPVDGVTTQSLAELVAACVWPTVTRAREKRPSTGPA